MQSRVQILGLSKYYPAVLFDILSDLNFKVFEIYANLGSNEEPELPIRKFHYQIMEQGADIDKNSSIILGVSGPKNKFPVFEYFKINQGLSIENLTTIIHKSSYLAPSCEIGNGVFIEQNCTISSQSYLGDCVSLKRGVTIGHHCFLDNWIDVNPGVTISGKVKIGKATVIGSGAVVLDGVSIGDNTLIGAGSVVTKDIPSGVIAFGNPCRVIKDNDKWGSIES